MAQERARHVCDPEGDCCACPGCSAFSPCAACLADRKESGGDFFDDDDDDDGDVEFFNDLSVAAVVMRTTRDDTGIEYSVIVETRNGDGPLDDSSTGFVAWVRRVDFGQTDATCAGGYVFVRAARDQQDIADDIWQKTVVAGVPWVIGNDTWAGR